MKARKVKGLDPAETLVANARRIVATRADELYSFDPHGDPEALHDMRIAAKRLRYVLEPTQHLFGPYVGTAVRRTKELQDLLGELHDCDDMLPRVTRIMATEHAAEAAELRARAAPDARDLDPATVRDAPRADAWRGLHAFAAWLEARRSVLHDAFLRQWTDLGRAGFRARLEYALAERAPEPPAPDPEPALAARTEP